MPERPRQGILHATLVAPDAQAVGVAYAAQLPLQVVEHSRLATLDAQRLQRPELAVTPQVWLANHEGTRVLRVLEDPQAQAPDEVSVRHGWMVVEYAVGELDALVARLQPPFRVLREPADLDFSPGLRAAQIMGPAGEVFYLTRIEPPVPPFDLPQVDATQMRPFIGVLASRNRDASQRAWLALLGTPGWQLHTRIGLVNRALGLPTETRHAIALLPMPGQCLVEIDELALPQSSVSASCGWLSLGLRLPEIDPTALEQAGWSIHRHPGALVLRGPDGEHVELADQGLATG